METIELPLDEETAKRAREAAANRHCGLEELFKKIIQETSKTEAVGDPIRAVFADEPEFIHEVVRSAMESRSRR